MPDYLLQNFSWSSFSLAFGAFILLSSLLNLVTSYIRKVMANKKVREAENKFVQLRNQMQEKERELNDLLSRQKENK